jgi:fumarate hydratase class II
MVAAQVTGNDVAITLGGQSGIFELNVMLPLIARNLLESIRLLASVSRALADRCVAGIEANADRLKGYAESSPSIGTSLNPYIGYERAAEVIKESTKTGRPIRDLVLERKWMTADELDRALDVLALTKGGVTK